VTSDSKSLDGVTGLEEILDELVNSVVISLVCASQTADDGRGVSNALSRISSSEWYEDK
jgi:hypothetical protein